MVIRVLKKDLPTSKELYEMLKADPEAMKHFLEVTEPDNSGKEKLKNSI